MSISYLLPLLVILAGAYFLTRLRFFFIRHPVSVLKRIAKNSRDEGSRRALMLALAGTLGVGNIVGVAYGIKACGAGVVFWILASALFSAPLKYAESYIASLYGSEMGIVYSVKDALGRRASSIYALLTLVLSFVLGGGLQARSVISSADSVGIPSLAVCAALAALVLFAILGGARKIEGVNACAIPIATVFYIMIMLAVVFKNLSSLPEAVLKIACEALDFRALGGGVSSFLAIKAMREGFSRGLLSNEAGAGSSSMAEARSSLSPSDVGLFGILEVVFDTVILSTLTGVAIVASGVPLDGGGVEIVTRAIASVFGKASPYIVFIVIFVFSYSAVICRYYYADSCLGYLASSDGERKKRVLIPLYILIILFCGGLGERLLISLSDILLLLMTLITVISLIKNSERIKAPSEKFIKEV